MAPTNIYGIYKYQINDNSLVQLRQHLLDELIS